MSADRTGEETPRRTPTSWFAAVVADPSISRATDGRLTLNWDADAPDHCVVHRAALVDLIVEMGGLHDAIDKLNAEAMELRALIESEEYVGRIVDGRRDRLIAAGSAMERLLGQQTMGSLAVAAIGAWREAVRS